MVLSNTNDYRILWKLQITSVMQTSDHPSNHKHKLNYHNHYIRKKNCGHITKKTFLYPTPMFLSRMGGSWKERTHFIRLNSLFDFFNSLLFLYCSSVLRVFPSAEPDSVQDKNKIIHTDLLKENPKLMMMYTSKHLLISSHLWLLLWSRFLLQSPELCMFLRHWL